MRMPREKLLLLSTVGRRTGQTHTTPVMFLRTEDQLLVIASAGGAPTDPQWYLNLVADPEVTVEVGSEKYSARAEVLTGAIRDLAWDKVIADMPMYADYQVKTQRTIPVVNLVRS